jgi:hypothetical protein
MAPHRKPGPQCVTASPSFDDGTLCRQQSPTPGPVCGSESSNQKITAEEEPISGSIPVSLGAGSLLRIPVPGSKGLAVELTPRGYIPKGGSTQFLFIQDITGKRHLNLDFSFNKNSQLVEWHWNQKGTYDTFGITDHTSGGTAEQALGTFAKYYKYAGRVFLVGGAALDLYSIVTASRPLRRSVQVVSGWAAAAGGCRAVGAGGAAWGTAIEPGLGTAVGGFIGCAIGAFIGYRAAEAATGYLYDWAEDTVFTKLQPEKEFEGGGGSSGGGGATGTW